MAIEPGGNNGVTPGGAVTEYWEKSKPAKPYEPVTDNRDARFHSVRRYKSAAIEPTGAKPHSPDNRATARECHGIMPDRAFNGSCTGGRHNEVLPGDPRHTGLERKSHDPHRSRRTPQG